MATINYQAYYTHNGGYDAIVVVDSDSGELVTALVVNRDPQQTINDFLRDDPAWDNWSGDLLSDADIPGGASFEQVAALAGDVIAQRHNADPVEVVDAARWAQRLEFWGITTASN